MSNRIKEIEIHAKEGETVSYIVEPIWEKMPIYGGNILEYPNPDNGEKQPGYYYVEFDANGGEGAEHGMLVYPNNVIYLPDGTTFFNESKVFNGWTDGDRKYGPGQAYTVTKDVVFSADWEDIDVSRSAVVALGEVDEITTDTGVNAYELGTTWSRAAIVSVEFTTVDGSRLQYMGPGSFTSRVDKYEWVTVSFWRGKNTFEVDNLRIGVKFEPTLQRHVGWIRVLVNIHENNRVQTFEYYGQAVGKAPALNLISTKIYVGPGNGKSIDYKKLKPYLKTDGSPYGQYFEYFAPYGTAIELPGADASTFVVDGIKNFSAWMARYNGVYAYFPLGTIYTVGTFVNNEGNRELIPYFRDEPSTVVFDYNGGTIESYSQYDQLAYVVPRGEILQLNGAGSAKKGTDILIGWEWANNPDDNYLYPPTYPFEVTGSYVVLRAKWIDAVEYNAVQLSFVSTLDTNKSLVLEAQSGSKMRLPYGYFQEKGYYISAWRGRNVSIQNTQTDRELTLTVPGSDTSITVEYDQTKFTLRVQYDDRGTVSYVDFPNKDSSMSFNTAPGLNDRGDEIFAGWATNQVLADNGIWTYLSSSVVNISEVAPILTYSGTGEIYILKLYAVWRVRQNPNIYTLRYHPNDTIRSPASNMPGTTTAEVIGKTECAFDISQMRPIRDGWTFRGWSKSPTSITVDYEGGDRVNVLSTDTYDHEDHTKVLYAVWTRNKFVLNFMSGGSSAPWKQTIEYSTYEGLSTIIPTTIPTYGSREFEGWADTDSATSPTYLKGSRYTFKTHSVVMFEDENEIVIQSGGPDVIYAVWIGKVTQIMYDPNGGTGPTRVDSSDEIAENILFKIWDPSKGYTESMLPVKPRFTFLGWSSDKRATVPDYQTGNSVRVKYNDILYLYAVWSYNYVDYGAKVEYNSQGVIIKIIPVEGIYGGNS